MHACKISIVDARRYTKISANLVEPLNKGHFGDNINSADLFFVERFSSLGGSKCIVGIILGP